VPTVVWAPVTTMLLMFMVPKYPASVVIVPKYPASALIEP
jgi:hypothetical protein